MNIPWDKLFEFLTYLVDNCMAKGRKVDDIRQSLTDPNAGDWWAVFRALGTEGIRGRERRAYMRALDEQSKLVSGTLVDEIISEAKSRGGKPLDLSD